MSACPTETRYSLLQTYIAYSRQRFERVCETGGTCAEYSQTDLWICWAFDSAGRITFPKIYGLGGLNRYQKPYIKADRDV